MWFIVLVPLIVNIMVATAYNILYRQQRKAIKELDAYHQASLMERSDMIDDLMRRNFELAEQNASLVTLIEETGKIQTAEDIKVAAMRTREWLAES